MNGGECSCKPIHASQAENQTISFSPSETGSLLASGPRKSSTHGPVTARPSRHFLSLFRPLNIQVTMAPKSSLSTNITFPNDLDLSFSKKKKKTSTLPITTEKMVQPRNTPILNPTHHLSFVALSLGFLFIWTCVISGLLLSNSISDRNQIDEAVTVFNGHEDVGRVLFALGHEMVSTVEVLLASQRSPRSEMDTYSKEALQITWQMTDLIMNNVIQRNHMKLASLLQMPYDRWIDFRSRSVAFKTDPRESVELYLLIGRFLEKEYRSFFPISVFAAPSSSASFKTPLINTGIAYSLFNSGMFKRFAEMAIGTYYVKSDLNINLTEYLELQYASKSLIESAFQFHPKAQNRYFELRVEDEQIEEALALVRGDIINGGVNRNDNKLAASYLDGVKNEIARLLLTKDYLNTTIANQIKLTTQMNKNAFLFYLSVTIIALVAVSTCLLLLCCSLRSIVFRTTPPRREVVYKANAMNHHHHHHNHHLSSNELRTRTQTMPIETIFNPFSSQCNINSQSKYNISSPSPKSSSPSTTSTNNNNNSTPNSSSSKPRCYL